MKDVKEAVNSVLGGSVVKGHAPTEEQKQKVTKQFDGSALKANIEDNTLRVVCSTVGQADRSGDVIFPGAYSSVAKDFLRNGFVAIGHEWDELPVAMPTSLSESGSEVVSEAVFHSTQQAQDARTVCKERMDAGKSVSLSVGFMPDYADPDGVVYFDKGTDLLAWAKGKGYDMAKFDVSGISKLSWCRAITKIAELFEWSIVGVGMNRGAKALAVKSLSGDEGPHAGQSFADHLDSVLAAVAEVSSRAVSYKSLRDRDGRAMSPDRVEQLKALRAGLDSLLETAPDPEPGDREERIKRKFAERAHLIGTSK